MNIQDIYNTQVVQKVKKDIRMLKKVKVTDRGFEIGHVMLDRYPQVPE